MGKHIGLDLDETFSGQCDENDYVDDHYWKDFIWFGKRDNLICYIFYSIGYKNGQLCGHFLDSTDSC